MVNFIMERRIGIGEQPEHYIYILLNKDENAECTIDYIDDDPLKKLFHNPIHGMKVGVNMLEQLRWTRFGEIDTFRWNRRDTEDLSEWK